MKIYHNSFNLGFKLGNLSRDVELAIETQNKKNTKERHIVDVYRVYEILKYIYDELCDLDILNAVTSDIKSYLGDLTGFGIEKEREKINKGLISKVKNKASDYKLRLDRSLSHQQTSELNLKLKMWKDKFVNEFIKFG